MLRLISARACLLALALTLAGCASSSSSGIELSVSRGDATGAYAGTYAGTISLTSTADVVALGSATDQRIESVSVSVTHDGLVFLSVRGVTISGVVDNVGNWGLQASIDDLRSLLSETNISRLNDAGCSLGQRRPVSRGSSRRLTWRPMSAVR